MPCLQGGGGRHFVHPGHNSPMPNLNPIPSYLSEDDALTVNLFLQSEYARDFSIDIRNIHWGGEIHHSHVFDIYSVFSPSKDPVTVRLDMLKFVADNEKRYDWNGHFFLQMNQLILDNWVLKMTHWDNCADPLAIYALSDMLGIHHHKDQTLVPYVHRLPKPVG